MSFTSWELLPFNVFYSEEVLSLYMWFLYAYIAFLMLLPISRSIARNLSNNAFIYIIVIHVFFRMLPVIEFILWKSQYTLKSTIVAIIPLNTLLFPCIGYFLEHRIDIEKAGKRIIWLWGGTLLMMAICCYATYIRGLDMGRFGEDISQSFHSNTNFLISMCVYLSIKYLCVRAEKKGRKRINKRLERLLLSLSGCTLGIYLIHPILKEIEIFRELLKVLSTSFLPPLLSVWIYILAIYIASYLIVLAIKKAGAML